MSDASGCTRIDTLRHALEHSGAERKELLFRLSMASTEFPEVRQAIWRLNSPKRPAQKARGV